MDKVFDDKTICIHCQHCTHSLPGLQWHDYQCQAPAVQRTIWNFVTGTQYAKTILCLEINHGNCLYYQKRD